MMLQVSELEKRIGIGVYVTSSLGIGGSIKRCAEDFIVEEVLVDGSRARVDGVASQGVLGSSNVKCRYLLCVLIKHDWDTFSAVRAIANRLRISSKDIKVAGIKDAKALTAQHIAIDECLVEEAKVVKIKDLDLLPIGYFHNRFSSYYLLGNSFRIIVSNLSISKSTVQKRISKTLRDFEAVGGVPNFFGHQRFGTVRPITHEVGKAIINRDFHKAAMIFLARPSPYEHAESRKARENLWSTHDFEEALKCFPKQLRYERAMLKHLVKHAKDNVGAFKRLPDGLQRLFVQAYQSYLFNRFLSKRLTAGLRLDRVEVGDYVVSVERSGLPMTAVCRSVNGGSFAEINKRIKAGRMRLSLPSIGFRQRASEGTQGEIEKEILEEEGVEQASFKVKALPHVSSRGGLRVALTPLMEFSFKLSHDAVCNMSLAANIVFFLYRGSYATVVLRELMKPKDLIKAGF